MQSTAANTADSHRRAAAFIAAVVAIIAIVAFGLLIAMGQLKGAAWSLSRAEFDQNLFHLKVITKFAAEIPAPNLRDYLSATTPGFHLVLALVQRVASPDLLALRGISAMFTVVLLALVAWSAARSMLARGAGPLLAAASALVLAACVGCSSYVLQSGLYLLPDNAAWLLVYLTMLLSLFIARSPARVAPLLLGGLFVALLVFTRQIHLWAAAMLWAAAVVAVASMPPTLTSAPARAPSSLSLASLLRALPKPHTLLALGVTVPAFTIVAAFAITWGGLAPPMFRAATNPAAQGGALADPSSTATVVTGISPATPAFILALLGVFGLFFLPILLHVLRHEWKSRPLWRDVTLGTAAATAIALLAPTTFSMPTRFGALWNITRKFEGDPAFNTLAGFKLPTLVIGHANLVIVALAALGGAILALYWRALDHRVRWVLAVGLAGFVAAMSAQALSWQRYFEPMLLLWLITATLNLRTHGPMSHGPAAASAAAPEPKPAFWWLLGPVALALLLTLVTRSQLGI